MSELVGSRQLMLLYLSSYLILLQPVISTGPFEAQSLSLTKEDSLLSRIFRSSFLTSMSQRV